MDVQTAPIPEAAQQQPLAKRSTPSALGWTLLFFALTWAVLYGLWRGLPYLKNGSDVVFSAKLQWEHQGQVFPADPAVTRVLIFGTARSWPALFPLGSTTCSTR